MSILFISVTVTKTQDEVLYFSKRLIFRNIKSISSYIYNSSDKYAIFSTVSHTSEYSVPKRKMWKIT